MTTKTTKPKSSEIIDKVNNRTRITAEIIEKAKLRIEAEREKQKEETLIRHIQYVEEKTSDAVENVRHFKKMLENAKKVLKKFNEAEEQFLLDADFEKYQKTILNR